MSELNTMQIGDHVAVIAFDPEIEMFRGEFTGLNGGADFYGASINELRTEGERSLQTFLDVCQERGIEPIKKVSTSYSLRLTETVKAAAEIVAKARRVSLNKLIETALEHEVIEVARVNRAAVKTPGGVYAKRDKAGHWTAVATATAATGARIEKSTRSLRNDGAPGKVRGKTAAKTVSKSAGKTIVENRSATAKRMRAG